VNLDQATSARHPGDAGKELRCQRCGYKAIVIGYLPNCPMCQATAWDELDPAPSTPASFASSPDSPRGRPTWEMVEQVLAELSETQASFSGLSGRTYQLERYQRNWRVLAVADASSRWVELEDIRSCWDTFERLGRIQREDVLDPGRCSSFMMALFEQVPGIQQTAGESTSLSFA
jgi:hypothetical protein